VRSLGWKTLVLATALCAAQTCVHAQERITEEQYISGNEGDPVDFAPPPPGSADEDSAGVVRTAPAAVWQRLTEPPAYSYRNLVEGAKPSPPPKKEEPRETPWIIQAIAAALRFFATTFGKLLLVGVLAGLIIYILYRVFGGPGRFSFRRAKRMDGGAVETDDSEAALASMDFASAMTEAARRGAYREAVRFGYLHLLQRLQEEGRIRYRTDKTNRDYLAEIGAHPAAPAFRAASRRFEWAWYGAYPVSEAEYADFRAHLQTLTSGLPQ